MSLYDWLTISVGTAGVFVAVITLILQECRVREDRMD